ncbi:hypothetical protein MKZ38_004598 [Zalerion maritima]|uniref:DUF6594 domain-containing protein n=1 Tax=Zalerion maritima TaxID=339359 RepID=A0AAD5RWJ5_9PEZI|nr:hypothetical protein MKZ38_004598 [Zalerion maritima]
MEPPIIDGYADVARWISQYPDNEPFIFRKFDELGAYNLLYIQSEHIEIEARLKSLNNTIHSSSDPDLWSAGREWEALIQQQDTSTQDEYREEVRQMAGEQMNLIKELRAKIKEYHEALLLQSRIANLHRPDSRVLRPCQQYLKTEHPISGKAIDFLDNPQHLVALKTAPDQDFLSRFLRRRWGRLPHTPKTPSSPAGPATITILAEHLITNTANVVTILLSAFFLVGSIVGLISLFTVGFAGSVALVTNARTAANIRQCCCVRRRFSGFREQ